MTAPLHPIRRSGRNSPNSAAPDADTEPQTISGTIERIVYRSEDTGYTVCALRGPRRTEIMVVGTCAAAWAGMELKAEGLWVRHPTHGLQFEASRMLCVEPCSAEGIRRYLASGIVRGIGPTLARRLVERFGTDTLRVIEKESALLLRVGGIGPMRRERIKRAWADQKAVQEIMLFLHTHGVSSSQAARIHRQYGDAAVALIKENPYRLAADIWGIGFKTADKIACSIGVPPDSPMRARAGVVHALQCLTDDGHCYCPRAELVRAAESLLNMRSGQIETAIDEEIARKSLVAEDDRIFLASLYYSELGVAAKVLDLRRVPVSSPIKAPDKAIAWAAGRMGIEFAPGQAEALRAALTEKVSIITGGPGVGKTTIVRALVEIFGAKRLAVALAAPTGRAAKRMEEATGKPAMTLHRMLKYAPGTGGFAHGPDKTLDGDVFILDEVSMIDIALMNAFLRALPNHARLVLVGDADQLPSVGPGNVLRDMLDSGVIPSARLTTIFRQKDRSWIVHNAHRVNSGQPIELPPAGQNSDFYFVEANNPDTAVQRTLELVASRIPMRFGMDPRTDIQLLTPMRRFQLGSENLNSLLQERLNPGGETVSRFGRVFKAGDRVMQLRNNYDKDVFNGDIGFIRALDAVNQMLSVDFDGRAVEYDLSEIDELSLAYACSIHKSQGSEHPAVVILLSTQHFKLLQRNLLYTAITRGRRLVCLVGSAKAVSIAIRNNTARGRFTGLRERLKSGAGLRVEWRDPDGDGTA